jgi:hypothetical protein
VLLYWDEVGSIVPSPYEADRSRLTPYMAELVEAELVLPIVPARYDEYLSRALRPFLEFVDSDPEIAVRSGGPLGAVSAPRGRAPVGSVVQIHRDKFAVHTEGFSIHGGKLGHALTEELLQRGLAREGDGDWFEVEARTGSAYMAFLAAGLGGLPEVDMDPITDRVSNLASFAGTESPDDPIALANALAMRVVEGVLPGPAEGVAVGELADFKERHGALLARFRARLESHLLDIAAIPDERLRERKFLVLTEELQAELEEVEARMRERNWPRLVFGTLCSVLGAAIPVGTALATGALPVAAAGAPGLASAVYSAKQAMRGRRDFEQAPLAYAALARERLATT